jgi:DeoR family fructose operon transcriptional repressor
LKRFTISTAFLGASGLSEIGVTVSDFSEAQLKAAVVAKAQRVVLPIDHTKVGMSDFAHVCDITDVDVIVTDQVTERLERLCRGLQVHLVSALSDARRH